MTTAKMANAVLPTSLNDAADNGTGTALIGVTTPSPKLWDRLLSSQAWVIDEKVKKVTTKIEKAKKN